jgi:hypothetical protein
LCSDFVNKIVPPQLGQFPGRSMPFLQNQAGAWGMVVDHPDQAEAGSLRRFRGRSHAARRRYRREASERLERGASRRTHTPRARQKYLPLRSGREQAKLATIHRSVQQDRDETLYAAKYGVILQSRCLALDLVIDKLCAQPCRQHEI